MSASGRTPPGLGPDDADADRSTVAELAQYMTQTGIDYLLLFVGDTRDLPDIRLVQSLVQARRTVATLQAEFQRRCREAAEQRNAPGTGAR